MANIYVDQGLDAILGVFPKNGANFSTLYMGLFTSQTATTVPARSTNYARQAVSAGDWSAPTNDSTGRKITASQVTYPAAGSGGWGTVNGFFLATQSAAGGGDKIVYFANFDDDTAVAINAGDILKVTPSVTLLG